MVIYFTCRFLRICISYLDKTSYKAYIIIIIITVFYSFYYNFPVFGQKGKKLLNEPLLGFFVITTRQRVNHPTRKLLMASLSMLQTKIPGIGYHVSKADVLSWPVVGIRIGCAVYPSLTADQMIQSTKPTLHNTKQVVWHFWQSFLIHTAWKLWIRLSLYCRLYRQTSVPQCWGCDTSRIMLNMAVWALELNGTL